MWTTLWAITASPDSTNTWHLHSVPFPNIPALGIIMSLIFSRPESKEGDEKISLNIYYDSELTSRYLVNPIYFHTHPTIFFPEMYCAQSKKHEIGKHDLFLRNFQHL